MEPNSQIEILQETSSGRFSKFFKARHRRLNNFVGVEIFGEASCPADFNEIIDNVNTLKKSTPANHHVCKYIQSFILDAEHGLWNVGFKLGRQCWVVTEHCDGGTLQDLMLHSPNQALPQSAIAGVCASIVVGLSGLHGLGLVHGKLCPTNVVFTQRGQCKLRCGAVSNKWDVQASKNASSFGALGPPPELLQETAQRQSLKSDIWAVGALTMFMADGRASVGQRQVSPQEKAKRTLELAAVCSDDFNFFVFSCLHKNPRLRLTAQMLAALPFVRDEVAHQHKRGGSSEAIQAQVQALQNEFQKLKRRKASVSRLRHVTNLPNTPLKTKAVDLTIEQIEACCEPTSRPMTPDEPPPFSPDSILRDCTLLNSDKDEFEVADDEYCLPPPPFVDDDDNLSDCSQLNGDQNELEMDGDDCFLPPPPLLNEDNKPLPQVVEEDSDLQPPAFDEEDDELVYVHRGRRLSVG